MKQLVLCMLFLAAGLFADEYVTGNKTLDLKVENGVVRVFLKGAETPILTIKPTMEGDVVADTVTHPDSNYKILSLRTATSSVTFRMGWTVPDFTMSLNRGASPVVVEWNAQAVIVPDVYAENFVIEPREKPFTLPYFVPMYAALTQNGDAMVSCIPVKAGQHAVLSGDLKTLTLNQRNTDDYTFVITAAKQVWHATKMSEELNKPVAVEGWTMPFVAEWQASLPVDKDFIPAGDGIHTSWNVARFEKNDKGKERLVTSMPRMSLLDVASRNTWTSGFESTFHYPVEIADGKLLLCAPRFGNRDRFLHSFTKNVYVYAFGGGKDLPEGVILPSDYIPKWVSNNQLCLTSNYGRSPATCATTNHVEALFRKDEAKEKVGEIRNRLAAMQFFVESIRARVENARVNAQEIAAFADREVKAVPALAPEAAALKTTLAEVERLYEKALPRIQYPPEVIKMSAEMVALATSDMDDEEKEEKAKALGRAIRTIGGGQDNLAAHMRHVGKCLRFQALTAYGDATTQEARDFWAAVYDKTAWMLQAYYGHEGR